jgi:hypothetical protein
MNRYSTPTTPLVRVLTTVIGLVGFLVVGTLTGTLQPILSLGAVISGLTAAGILFVLVRRNPDEFVSTLRLEVLALLLVVPLSYLVALYSPATFGAMVWVLLGTLVPLTVLVVRRPRGLARWLARTEQSVRADS